MWDQRYGLDGFAYGREPNDFLAARVADLPRGRALCLAEGEGRNAVFLASQGWQVVAVDQSSVGLAKAHTLASEAGVSIETITADLADFELGESEWDLIVSVWCHVPPSLRAALHRKVVAGLRPGGAFLLEAYSPQQVGRGTGGPPAPELTMSADGLRQELTGLRFDTAQELERDVQEGRYHNGMSAVVQLLAFRDAD